MQGISVDDPLHINEGTFVEEADFSPFENKEHNLRRLGIVEIDQHIMKRFPRLAQLVLAQLVIVRAEARFDRDTIEYIAFSSHFDFIQMGLMAPRYIPFLVPSDEFPIERRSLTVSFQKCKDDAFVYFTRDHFTSPFPLHEFERFLMEREKELHNSQAPR